MTMAFSRLRHHFIARSPSIFMAHIPFSFAPLAYTPTSIRTSCTISSLVNGGHLLPRSVFCCSIAGVHRGCLSLKVGGRQFSSADSSHMVIGMPALSPTMTQGNITKWRKKEGDKIDVGDVICEIETDKATLEFESLEEGFLGKILVPEGTKDVTVGQPIAITVEVAEDIEDITASSFTASGAKEDIATPHEHLDKSTMQARVFSRISPAARLLVAKSRLDPSLLKASGPHGILLKGDVLDVVKLGNGFWAKPSSQETTPSSRISQKTSPATRDQIKSQIASDSFEDLPNSQIRKVIARRLLESKQNMPHLYLSSDVALDPLIKFRRDLQEQHGIKVSVNDIIIKVVAVALRNVPEANGYWDDAKGEIVFCDSVDISVAVATEKGLMTPIVRNADQKTLSSISAEVKSLAEKARAGKLAPQEFQGGTFSISNLGMFPVDQFCAIINPPQACILAVGRGNKVVEPVIGNDGAERPAVVTKMKLTLSADHRVFDGKVGGALISSLKLNFGDIHRLLL